MQILGQYAIFDLLNDTLGVTKNIDYMKARLMIAALAFVALSSVAVAQDKTQKADSCKMKTECCKSKEAVKPASCAKTKTCEKKADKTAKSTKTAKTVVTKK